MIALDRLILDIPGMSPDRASRIARAIGSLLAARPGLSDIGRIDLRLKPGESEDVDIVAAIVAALDGESR